MRDARRTSGFLRTINWQPFERFVMRTNDTVQNEVFGSLEFISEIEDVGKSFLRSRGQTIAINKSFSLLQAFIRQSKTFYEAAEVLHYRASSLNYYYSFLNLVKAYITIFEPDFVDKRVGHGIHLKPGKGALLKQFVICEKSGVFPKFYQLVTTQSLRKGIPLKIVDLLGYCTDVTWEYEQAQLGPRRIAQCKFAIVVSEDTNRLFSLLAVLNFDAIRYFKKSLEPFNNNFEEVNLPKDVAREYFNIMGEEKKHYKFFEGKSEYNFGNHDTIPMADMIGDSHTAMKNFFMSNPYEDGFDFLLAAPLRRNLQIPMNEIIAIYLVMFFLGSLVRYRPDYLERIFASKDAWIIERFAKAAPVTFLRYARNLIDGRNFVYVSR